MNTETVGDVLVITLPARMDAAQISAIEGPLIEALAQQSGAVLVDMSAVEFVASLALRLLLTQHKELRQRGGDLRLCGLSPAIAEVFRKSRFDTLFTIYPDRASALAEFTS
jgi:anti-sigma B factor antagonist